MTVHVVVAGIGAICGAQTSEGDASAVLDPSGPESRRPQLSSVSCEDCKPIYSHILECGNCMSELKKAARTGKPFKLVRPEDLVSALGPQLAAELIMGVIGRLKQGNPGNGPQRGVRQDLTVDLARQLDRAIIIDAMFDPRELAKKMDFVDFGSRNGPAPRATRGSRPTERRKDSMNHQRSQVPDVEVLRSGERLVIPEGMSYEAARNALDRRMIEDAQHVSVKHEFDMTPPEGALALVRTLKELFGFVSSTSRPGPWGSTELPEFQAVPVSPSETEEAPWGRLVIPDIEGFVETSMDWKNGSPFFVLTGEVAGRDKPKVDRIAEHIRSRNDRMYAGKVIKASFPDPEKRPPINDFFPSFVSLPDDVSEETLIFPRDVEHDIQTTVFTPIEHAEFCRQQGISIRRGILFEGPYGVGKTLTATVIAQKCVQHGFTFIYLANVRDLPRAYAFARRYQPAVIFAEDIDQVLSDPNKRNDEINAILNSSDGIESKDAEIITILTTNNVGVITTAMLRPGRLDTIITLRTPDEEAVGRLISLYADDQLARGQNLAKVCEALAGNMPAMVHEVVKRARLAGIRRAAKGRGTISITSEDLESAARSMKRHMELLQPAPADLRSDREKAADAVAAGLERGLEKVAAAVGGAARLNGKSKEPAADAPAASSSA